MSKGRINGFRQGTEQQRSDLAWLLNDLRTRRHAMSALLPGKKGLMREVAEDNLELFARLVGMVHAVPLRYMGLDDPMETDVVPGPVMGEDEFKAYWLRTRKPYLDALSSPTGQDARHDAANGQATRRVLLLESYCEGRYADSPDAVPHADCSDALPCRDCLGLCDTATVNGEFISDLGCFDHQRMFEYDRIRDDAEAEAKAERDRR